MKIFKFLIFSLLFLTTKQYSWTLSNNKTNLTNINCPTSVYSELFKIKLIKNPFSDNNSLLRVINGSWTYSTEIDTQNFSQIYLILKNVDLKATVYINNVETNQLNNAFREYYIDVKEYSPNLNVKIVFENPVSYAKSLNKLFENPILPTCPPEIQNGECHINLIRKPQCSFSWDWGPAIPDISLGNANIVHFEKIFLRYINVFTARNKKDNNTWDVSFKAIFFAPNSSVPFEQPIEIGIEWLNDTIDKSFSKNYSCDLLPDLLDNYVACTITLENIQNVELWWPNGFGSQTLYDIVIKHYENFPFSPKQQSRKKRIGFRTVQLIQDPLPNDKGRTYYFKVNGVPIFAKGSNWIPANLVAPEITQEYVKFLLQSAQSANMNMLRVWGGGMYESETFYDTADELGILIWQDSIFASALYPGDKDFLQNVQMETIHQARRLQSHPSLVMWCANNENELAFKWFPIVNISSSKQDYINLYYNTIYKTLEHVLTYKYVTFPIALSSPSNGIVEILENSFISKNPQDWLYGDVHHYDYTSDLWNWRVYPTPRFCSEYGVQSWPSFQSLYQYTSNPDRDLQYGSHFLKIRQHHIGGDLEMIEQIGTHFKFYETNEIEERPLSKEMLKKIIYLSQLHQAISIQIQTEHYRRSSGIYNKETGYGLTMGALFWQLNDVWTAPSWSAIEYGGTYKMLYYFAREFFQSPHFTIHDDLVLKDSNTTHLIYTLLSDINMEANISLAIDLNDLTSFDTHYSWKHELGLITIQSASLVVLTQPMQDIFDVLNQKSVGNINGTYIKATMHISISGKQSPFVIERYYFFSYTLDWPQLSDPGIRITDVKPQSDEWLIVLNASKPAYYVWLELNLQDPTCFKEHKQTLEETLMIPSLGTFSQNGFILTENYMEVTFKLHNITQNKSPLNLPLHCISIQSLYDFVS